MTRIEISGLERLEERLAQLSDPAHLLETAAERTERTEANAMGRHGVPGLDPFDRLGYPFDRFVFSFDRFAEFGEGDLDYAIEALVEGDGFHRSREDGMEPVHGAAHPFGGE